MTILSSGMSEGVYAVAARLELVDRAIAFEAEKSWATRYKGKFLCHQRLDVLVDGSLVVEIKSRDTKASLDSWLSRFCSLPLLFQFLDRHVAHRSA